VEALADRRSHAVVGDRCEVLDWYAERGWKPVGRRGAFALLAPPTVRDDLVPAASICLLDPVGRRVLVGHRRVEPWLGYHAFPGGRCEPGEAPLQTALRELEEETGIRLADPRPVRERTVYVGGEVGFAVRNFVVPVLDAPPPVPTAELDARWVPISELPGLRPMAAGTRRVLRGLETLRFPA
jgi:8-oxo-dGTP pyrophosphatase MutT (NUDIX family)